MVQLRCKGIASAKFLKYALTLAKMSRAFDLLFIVNDRADIALASGADGLHIGQDDITPYMARKILGKDKIIGLSTHSRSQVKEAGAWSDLDYIGIGPVFKTPLKPGMRPIGLKVIKDISWLKGIHPFFAIGGINTENIKILTAAGAERVAVSGAVFNSGDPVKATRVFREILS